MCSLVGLTAWTRPEPTKWAVVVKDGARAREADFGRKQTSFSGFVVRAQNITTTAHFVGLGRVQALSPCREHTLHAHNVRSDIRFGPWRRCSHLCSHLRVWRRLRSRVHVHVACTGMTKARLHFHRTSSKELHRGVWSVESINIGS